MSQIHGVSAAFDLGGEAYLTLHARVVERLDEVPHLVARLTRDERLPKPVTVLDQDATFKLGTTGQLESGRSFVGVVTRAVRRIDVEGRPFLEVTVEPKAHRLGKRTNCRTFLDKKVEEIIEQVCQEAGVPCRFQLSETYGVRSNVIQYRESDWELVRRIASEEGIAFVHDHASGELVFFDDATGLGEAEPASLPYVAEFGFDQSFACVQKVTREHRVVTDKVHVRGYDPARPKTLVEAKLEGKDDGEHALEVYAYPVRTKDEAAAKRFAQVLLDSIQSRRDVVRGVATAWTLAPGYRFEIEEHPFDALNTELLVTHVELTFSDQRTGVGEHDAKTSLSFEAIPTESSKYRPERRTRHREAPSVHVAMTTGAPGQEVDVDADGCVVGIFPWDRYSKKDDTASTRMRTLQLPTGGSMLLPRVGWEVLVQCDEGDPDTPLVVARLYNGVTMPPYALPGGAARSSLQTATTPGGGSSNELRTDDTAGSEEMFFNASKDMSIEVKNNTTESVGNNATLEVGGDQTLDITNSLTTVIGADQSLTVGGNQKTSIETFAVDQCTDFSLTIGGNRDMKVGGDHKHTVAGSETVEVGSMKTDLVVGAVADKIAGNMGVTVGAADVALTPADIALEAGGNYDEQIGAVKGIIAFGGVASQVTGSVTTQIAGAKLHKVDADRAEEAGAAYTSIAAGASIIKADNVLFEAEGLLSIVMGGSILVLTPASVSLVGVSVKLDGATAETAALVVDN